MVDKAILEFDKFLIKKRLSFKGVVIGGAALLVLEVSDRQTKEVDCLYPDIPPEIKKASEDFAREFTSLMIEEDWFNNGPQALAQSLPNGWENRLRPLFNGTSLKLETLGRPDLLKTKLFAYCDRTDPDFDDLLKLKPTSKELLEAIAWVKGCDENFKWPEHVDKMFSLLQEALNG